MNKLRLAPIALLIVAGSVVAACSSSSGGGSGSTQDDGGSDDGSGAVDGTADGTADADGSDATSGEASTRDSGGEAGPSDASGETGDASEAGAIDSAVEGAAYDGSATDGPSDGAPGDGSSGAEAAADAADAAPDVAVEAGPCVDSDGDGYFAGSGCTGTVDCDDSNPFVNPGMLELADDGVDNDCSGGDLTAAAGPGVYVDGASASCSDTASGRGTKTTPYCTIAKAVADAPTSNDIFVAKGTYPVAFITSTGTMNLFGGYESAAWTYDPAANVTTIGGQDAVQYTGGTTATAWVTWQGTGVLQGFHLSGGVFAADAGVGNFFTVDISTGAHPTLAYDTITGGTARGTIAVEIRTSASAFLFENAITGGTALSSGAFGVNGLGASTLFGNRIDCPNGTGMQNFSTTLLVANVINGGGAASNVAQTIGFTSYFSASATVKATLVGNDIFGGLGLSGSYGVQSSADITLVDNILGGHGPVPTAGASGDNVALFIFGGTATLVNNDFYTNLSSGTPTALYASTGDAGAYTHFASAAAVNGCSFNGCLLSEGALVAYPAFVAPGTGDFHIQSTSVCKGAGADPTPWAASGIARRDMDFEARPQGSWDIGADEIP